jgi:hypothetical protein
VALGCGLWVVIIILVYWNMESLRFMIMLTLPLFVVQSAAVDIRVFASDHNQ